MQKFPHLIVWLVAVLWAGHTPSAAAQTVLTISTVQQFATVNNALFAGEKDLTIVLTSGLDFSGSASSVLLPLGFNHSSHSCYPFSGTLFGKGNTLSNIQLDTTNESTTGDECASGAGLFCGLENAVITNVEFDCNCAFGGLVAGALSGCVGGNVTVSGVASAATVLATHAAGGLFAMFQTNLPD